MAPKRKDPGRRWPSGVFVYPRRETDQASSIFRAWIRHQP